MPRRSFQQKKKHRKQWKNQRQKEKDDEKEGNDDNNENDNSRRSSNKNNNSKNNNEKDFILTTVEAGNYKMEAYYAAQGMHDLNWKKAGVKEGASSSSSSSSLLSSLRPITSLEEWNAERLAWRTALGTVLPASFRFNGLLSPAVQDSLHTELQQLVQQAKEWTHNNDNNDNNNDDNNNNDDSNDEKKKEDATKSKSVAADADATTTPEDQPEDEQQQQQQKEEQDGNDDGDDTKTKSVTTTTSTTGLSQDKDKDKDNLAAVAAATTSETVAPTTELSSLSLLSLLEPLTAADTTLQRIPFGKYAYQWSVLDRAKLRKHPALQPLQKWLVQKTASGQVTRQETVSMIPPIVLLSSLWKKNHKDDDNDNKNSKTTNHDNENDIDIDIPNKQQRRRHVGGITILDMCAAPGSKTSQLLEGLAQYNKEIKQQLGKRSLLHEHSGVLIANDVHPQRANMLTHQLKRVLHHFPVAIVTAAPAQYLPSFQPPPQSPKSSSNRCSGKMKFILADVPCSGDGTTRKNIQVWRSWSQLGALALHALQVEIAWHGISRLLAGGDDGDGDDDGYLCYSTCSMNPIENEAVVAELLRRAPPGTLELVDARPILAAAGDNGDAAGGGGETFKTRPGWLTWNVLCEAESRKEMKQKDNKNKPKMLEKRKHYQLQEQQQQQQQQQQKEQDEENKKDDDNDDDDDKVDPMTLEDPQPAKNAAPPPPAADTHTDHKMVDETTNTTTNNNNNEDGTEPARSVALAAQRYNPTSIDPAYLLQLATETAGFCHFTNMDQVRAAGMQQRIRPSCFPPSSTSTRDDVLFPLDRCLRCVAHDNNTGGFFVALLRKTGTIPHNYSYHQNKKTKNTKNRKATASTSATSQAQSRSPDCPPSKRAKLETGQEDYNNNDDDEHDTAMDETLQQEHNEEDEDVTKPDDEVDDDDDDDDKAADSNNKSNNSSSNSRPGRRRSRQAQNPQDQLFVPVKDEILNPLIEYYGLSGPGFRRDLFMARGNSECKVIYFLAPSVKDFLFPQGDNNNNDNDNDNTSTIFDKVQVIATGLKAFVKNNSYKECPISHRLAQDAAHFLVPYLSTARKWTVSLADFEACLRDSNGQLHKGGAAIALSSPLFSTAFVNHVQTLDVGAFVVVLENTTTTTATTTTIGTSNKGQEDQMEHPDDQDDNNYDDDEPMVLVMWRCRGDHVNTLVSAPEVDAILSKLAVLKKANQKTAAAAAAS